MVRKVIMENKVSNSEIGHFYDGHIQDRYEDDYEFNRWHTSERLRTDFFMNYVSIKEKVSKIQYKSCLELGPGPGTWTRVLYKISPDSEYDLVDISNAMKRQFELEMRQCPNVNYHISDIMKFQTQKKYDLFFSSRAIEYLDDKSAFFKKINTLLSENGKGVIVTKNKEFGIRKKVKKIPRHQGQLSKLEMIELLKASGFKNIYVYPVIIRLPVLDRFSARFSERLFNRLHKTEMRGKWVTKFTESFIVTFEK